MSRDRDILVNFVHSRLSEKGGARFSKLSAADVRYLFSLYEKEAFGEQLNQRLDQLSFSLRFNLDSTSFEEEIPGKIEVDRHFYTVIIVPRVLVRLEGKLKISRLELLSITVKHQLIHLALLAWNYYGQIPKSTYSEYGSLFKCMLSNYFIEIAHTVHLKMNLIQLNSRYLPVVPPSIGEGPSTSTQPSSREGSLVIAQPSPKNAGGYQNWENSCYVDSVLMVLYECASGWWRRGMIERIPSPQDEDRGVCDVAGGSLINSPKKLYEQRVKIRDQLLSDYKQINNDETVIQCKSLRRLLRECLPSLAEVSENMRDTESGNDTFSVTYPFFNAGALYELLASLFPAINISIPVKTPSSNTVIVKKVAAVTMWDFMDPRTNDEGEEILWDSPLFMSPAIVFINGGAPRIKKFDEAGREKGKFTVETQKFTFDVVKKRAFGATILNGRYVLVGVVTLQGVSPTTEGGTHYISYFLGSDGMWYHYNDVTATITSLVTLPRAGVWEEKGGEMPAIYFYARV